jgi:hypothetical protein
VRWDLLWSDLASQASGWERADLEGEAAERELIESAAVTWMDRLRGSVGRPLVCRTRGGGVWRGLVVAHGADFVVLASAEAETAGPTHVVLRPATIRAVEGLSGRAVPVDAVGTVAARRTFGSLLRRMAVDRLEVAVHLDDTRVQSGDVGRVGQDYVDVVDEAGRVTSVVVDGIVAVTPR